MDEDFIKKSIEVLNRSSQDLTKDVEWVNTEYHREFYNECHKDEQWIRLTDGCFRDCWNCYCPKDTIHYKLPNIERNKVRFLDMNFLYAHPDPMGLLQSLPRKLNNRVVKYAFLCGLDYTLLTGPLLKELKSARVGRFNKEGNWIKGLSIAWDRGYDEADIFEIAIKRIESEGYLRKNIQVFMLCNGKISFKESVEKLRILKKLRVQIADCWYDNQKRGSVRPTYWFKDQCDIFGKLCRAHNIAVLHRLYDPIEFLMGGSQ